MKKIIKTMCSIGFCTLFTISAFAQEAVWDTIYTKVPIVKIGSKVKVDSWKHPIPKITKRCTETDPNRVTHLIINGTITDYFLIHINNIFPNLVHLDLSATNFEETYSNVSFFSLGLDIREGAFPNLQKIILPQLDKELTINSMGDLNIDSIIIPKNVSVIKPEAFVGCSNLVWVKCEEYVSLICSKAFKGCTSLTEFITNNPKCFGFIHEAAFDGCVSLQSIAVCGPIKDYTYRNCINLSSVMVKDKFHTIGKQAFFNSGITSIEIPSDVITIKDQAFTNCKYLKKISLFWENSEAVVIAENAFLNVDSSNCILEVPKGTKEKYEQIEIWKGFAIEEREVD